MNNQRKNDEKYFNKETVVSNFDEDQKGLIPGYDLIFQAIENVVSIHFENKNEVDGIILDIGAGTGNESGRILDLDKFKNMKILAIDYSKKMQRRFKTKIGQGNIENYITEDIMSLPESSIQNYTNQCRIALSGYTIHHFHTDEKREIYKKMFDLLAPGGLLLNIDLFTYESECIRQHAHDFEIKFINTNIKNECVKQEWLNHYNNTNNNDSHNALDPVEVQIDMLKEIGFVDVECVFRYWQQGIIRATKPSGDETAKKHSLFYLEKSIKIKNEILGSNNNNNKILEETNELNEAFKKELKNELGVLAVGISILSKAEEDIRFLIASEVPDIDILGAKTDNKHNFSISHEGFGEYDNFINFLYYIGRGNSIKYPEYLNRIKEKKQNPFENIIQQNARQKYETLHISAGEIILFTILWRYLIGEILKPTIDGFIKFFDLKDSTKELENPFEKDANEYHLIEKLKDLKNQVSKNEVEQSILKAWVEYLKILKNNSGITNEFGLNKERNKEALEDYVNFLFKDNKININNCQDNQFIEDVLILFVNKFGGGITAPSEILKILHEKARVPIMPFYFLMLGDKERNLKEQYVFPLLHTFSKENTMYPYTNDQGNKEYEPAVIHAMWVVKPIKDINNTSKQPWYSGKYSFTSYIERLHLISQSVCKPIIDEYFEKEHKKNISLINYQATRAAISQVFVRNIAHNLISHVLIHLTNEKAFSSKGIYSLINKQNAYQSKIELLEIKILEEDVQLSEANNVIDRMTQTLEWLEGSNKSDNHDPLKNTLWSFLSDECKNNIKEAKNQLQKHKATINEGIEKARNELKEAIDKAGKSFIDAFEEVSSLFDKKIYNEKHNFYPNKQIANLFSYVANRCLYLNEATYGVSNTVGIKRVYGELFKELDANRILLNHISGIDNFKYAIQFQHNGVDLSDTNDILVSLPADTLGAQAFYNILENIIRNAAKHNGTPKDMITFTVNFNDLTDSNEINFNDKDKYYCVEISDDIIIKGVQTTRFDDQKEIEDYKKYFDKEYTEQNNETRGEIDYLVFKQNTRMNNSVINPLTQTLRSNSLGLLEMEASAAFLRQIDLPQIEDDCYELKNGQFFNDIDGINYPYLMQAFKKEKEGGKNEYSLGYRFYMKKTEKYLVIVPPETIEDKEKLQNYGITVISRDDFLKSLEGNMPTRYNHEFALLVEIDKSELSNPLFNFFFESREEKKKEKRIERPEEQSLLPERLMSVDSEFLECLKSGLENKAFDDFEKKVWELWMSQKDGAWGNNTFIVESAINAQHVNKPRIVLLNHCSDRDKEDFKKCEGQEFYCEPLSTSGQQKLPHFNKLKGLDAPLVGYINNLDSNKDVHQQLWEAYDNRVLVIDERVQRFALDTYRDFPLMPIFKRMNVIIPNPTEINLEARVYDEVLIEKIMKNISEEIQKADFMLIHYGVLERIGQETIEGNLKKWANLTRVIVTTGRGKHSLSKLPKEVSYINLSTVLNAFRDNRNKYLINYIVNQSRR